MCVAAQLDKQEQHDAEHAGGIVDDNETGVATRRTTESLKAAERMYDALLLADAEVAARAAERREQMSAANNDGESASRKRRRIEQRDAEDEDADVDSPAAIQLEERPQDSAVDDEAADWARVNVPDSKANPLLLGLAPAHYVLRMVRQIPPATIDGALLALSFDNSVSLLRYVRAWMELGIATELSVRVAVFVVRLHLNTLV